MDSIFNIYDDIYKYKDINSSVINCDMKVKLIYELSDNKKSYIQGYMDSICFGDVVNHTIPNIN